jgi:peptidyl-prolyl cis-trans isomerase D
MLSVLRRSTKTWPVRLFFMLLVLSFGLWGVADVVRNIGNDGSVGSVAGQKIQLPELQEAYQREMAQATRKYGITDPTPAIRRMVANQAVSGLVTQLALQAEIRDLGVTVPDDALRTAVFDLPAFRGQNGQFDRALMANVLRSNGLTEQRFLDMMRGDLAQRQVLDALRAGVAAPAEEAKQVFAIQQEKRVADVVDVLLAAAPPPPAPTDLQLQRWWANHPEKYSTPEYRRVKAIVLAPETLAKEVQVSDDDLKAAWEQHKSEFTKPERRTVQVILTQDEAEAQRLAAQWSGGADWAAMQDAASKVGAAPVELTDATRAEFPAPELGDAVFATPEGVVPPPVHSALGWHVLKVTKVTEGGTKTFDEARDALQARVVAEKAADLIYDRANRIENLLSGGTTLDQLPGDLGVGAVTGTLDAQGNTLEGKPAPIPGPEALRKALVDAAFAEKPGDPPKLTQAPNAPDGSQSFFAVVVEDIKPPAPRPFADVAEQVRTDWTAYQVRHEQEETAAKLLGAVERGESLGDAATKAGLTVRRLPATGRSAPAEGFQPALLNPLFQLKKGAATMVETADGFIVAVLAEIQDPDPKADPVGFGQVQQALAGSIGQDIQAVFATAVRDRAKPRINQAAVDSIATPAE